MTILTKKKKGNYDQKGKKNNNYKDGISNYRQRAFERYGKKCQSCGSTKNLMVHHKDGNRHNNKLSNLKVLCWSCHEKLTARKVSNEIRIIHTPKPPNVLWGTGSFLVDGNKVLIGLRTDNNLWGTPGGKVEDYETPLEGVVRETFEETGLFMTDPKFLGTLYVMDGELWKSFVFVAESYTGNLRLQPSEIKELKWVPLKELGNYPLFGPTRESYEYLLNMARNFKSVMDGLLGAVINDAPLTPKQEFDNIATDPQDPPIETGAGATFTVVEQIAKTLGFNSIFELMFSEFVTKMTSLEQMLDVKNPGKDGGSGHYDQNGNWVYDKKPLRDGKNLNSSNIKNRPKQIQNLKQQYINYFSNKTDFKVYYEVKDKEFVFPKFKEAKDKGLVRNEKEYSVLFKEQYLHFILSK